MDGAGWRARAVAASLPAAASRSAAPQPYPHTSARHSAAALRAAQSRFIDLLMPFQKLLYYHPDFNGDFSIKSVLPAMFPNDPEADYAGLEISDGRAAMRKYDELAQIDDEGERRRARGALRDYCRLDTLAMVRIWQELLRLAN